MPQTVSVTEAGANFPDLVRQVTERDAPVVVTNHSQPRAVLIGWETYQQQQHLQVQGAKHQLQMLVSQMEQIIAGLLEAYQPDSFDLINGQQELSRLANEAWATCRLLNRPQRHLASLLADGFLNLANEDALLSIEQLARLNEIVPLLHQSDLTNDSVSQADCTLADVGFNSIIPFGDELVKLYFPIREDEG